MNLKYISDTILKKAKQKGISVNELAEIINVSRGGLYKSLENIGNMKFANVVRLCEVLEISLEETNKNNQNADSIDYFIDYNKINLLQRLLDSHKVSIQDICLFLNVSEEEFVKKLKSSDFEAKEIVGLCSFYKAPYELLFKEHYKTKYKGISIEDYINFRSMIMNSQNLINYNNEVTSSMIAVVKVINSIFSELSNINCSNIEYVELINSNPGISNFPVNIIFENSNIPIVFVSNYPNHYTSIQLNIEEVANKTYNNFLKDKNIAIGEVIWVELSYFSEEKLNISIVKPTLRDKFSNPVWYTLRGVSDNEIKIDVQKIKDFLEIK
ncbi:helix-turn-helix domain-containing protein [Plebeiibacterium sediminum]|uniref:Helix-turn-helix transcriptional regulator n=1 Tax=Plebeiibacterium sediminum TaxID=2992112 RepID=A0AAE3SGW4_9BACT|nr:helix-turn-helix transcriptional regulator [Plebeiobacterium sediminum]MCW3788908.1 helix-turn-helix transcriptional regulator [Plebeiobacterium sediminum]